jgi:H+/Cl- antiporter ClcA
MAALSLQLMNPFRTGKLVLFAVNYDRNWQIFEFPVFILLGILGVCCEFLDILGRRRGILYQNGLS